MQGKSSRVVISVIDSKLRLYCNTAVNSLNNVKNQVNTNPQAAQRTARISKSTKLAENELLKRASIPVICLQLSLRLYAAMASSLRYHRNVCLTGIDISHQSGRVSMHRIFKHHGHDCRQNKTTVAEQLQRSAGLFGGN